MVKASPSATGSDAWLLDITKQSRVEFSYQNGERANRFTILESLGGGVAMLDYNADGRLDIFVTGGGSIPSDGDAVPAGLPGKLFENRGAFQFEDVTELVGLTAAPFYTNGCLAGDFNNDGWPDLLITGFGGMILYRNTSRGDSDRQFVDVTAEIGLSDSRWCTSAAFGDIRGNGYADLYVCRYVDWSPSNDPACPRANSTTERDVCPPQKFKPLLDSLYENRAGKFTDISAEVGLTESKGLGVVLADFNSDTRPDLYVTNDADRNFLLINDGDGTLTESGQLSGVATDDNGRLNGSMGVDIGDVQGNGECSILVTNYQGELPALYVNLGANTFLYQSQLFGLGAVGQQFVGFGTALVDLQNDGWLDLVIVNGHVLRHPVGAPFLQKPLLFENVARRGRRFFEEISYRGGAFFAAPSLGRGLAVGDLDNDGWSDLVVSQSNQAVTILRNVASQYASAHWFGLELIGRDNRPVSGATIRLKVRDRELTRFSKSGGSYLSSSDPRIVFGLGEQTEVTQLSVTWPWGKVEQWDLPEKACDTYWKVIEGETSLQPAVAPR